MSLLYAMRVRRYYPASGGSLLYATRVRWGKQDTSAPGETHEVVSEAVWVG